MEINVEGFLSKSEWKMISENFANRNELENLKSSVSAMMSRQQKRISEFDQEHVQFSEQFQLLSERV